MSGAITIKITVANANVRCNNEITVANVRCNNEITVAKITNCGECQVQ